VALPYSTLSFAGAPGVLWAVAFKEANALLAVKEHKA
jgi:hypothetical protein